jgi:hypothetical protein
MSGAERGIQTPDSVVVGEPIAERMSQPAMPLQVIAQSSPDRPF